MRDRDFFGGGRECFPCINPRFGGWGQVREEEVLCCQFKAKIDEKLVFSWFLPDVLIGRPILPKPSLGKWGILFGGGGIPFQNYQPKIWGMGAGQGEEALCCQFKAKID